jgi:formate dehydrogenase subunit delta
VAKKIGKFLAGQGEKNAVPLISDHPVKLWGPRMRKAIVAHLAKGGAGSIPLRAKQAQPRRPNLPFLQLNGRVGAGTPVPFSYGWAAAFGSVNRLLSRETTCAASGASVSASGRSRSA